jgi:glutamate synthase (NADPH/NADH) small chain
MRTSSSHEEGCERLWGVMTKRLSGAETRVSRLHGCQVEWIKQPNGWKIKEIPGTDFVLEADIIILAMGFLHVDHQGLVTDLRLKLDERGNIAVEDYQTSEPWVFAAGDTITGASLVVHAINAGREAAAAIDRWLLKEN